MVKKLKILLTMSKYALVIFICICFQNCTSSWQRIFISSSDECSDWHPYLNLVLRNPKSLIVFKALDEEPQKIYLEGGIKIPNNSIRMMPSGDYNLASSLVSIEFNGNIIQLDDLTKTIRNSKNEWNTITIKGNINLDDYNFFIPNILNLVNKKRNVKIYIDPEETCLKILFKK